MPNNVVCSYRIMLDNVPRCHVVAELTNLPLAVCETNNSACEFCLTCKVAPQTPNQVTASLAIHAAERMGDTHTSQVLKQVRHVLRDPATATLDTLPCVYRGSEFRQQECKPCQADSRSVVMVSVFRCSQFRECTINNTGRFPKIQACSTCLNRTSHLDQFGMLADATNE